MKILARVLASSWLMVAPLSARAQDAAPSDPADPGVNSGSDLYGQHDLSGIMNPYDPAKSQSRANIMNPYDAPVSGPRPGSPGHGFDDGNGTTIDPSEGDGG